MDTGHIEGSGAGAIDRNPERPGRLEKSGAADQIPGRGDSASISDGGRETLAAMEALVKRLEGEPPGRREHVEAVRELLESGELDQPTVFLETARNMLMEGL